MASASWYRHVVGSGKRILPNSISKLYKSRISKTNHKKNLHSHCDLICQSKKERKGTFFKLFRGYNVAWRPIIVLFVVLGVTLLMTTITGSVILYMPGESIINGVEGSRCWMYRVLFHSDNVQATSNYEQLPSLYLSAERCSSARVPTLCSLATCYPSVRD